MLKLLSGPVPPTPVVLGASAVIWVRPATAFDVSLASQRARNVVAGLAAGQDAATQAALILGEDFAGADFTQSDWAEAVVERLIVTELASQCCTSWEGIVDESDEPVPLDKAALCLLMREAQYSKRISDAMNARLHVETTEEKKLQASPDGGAKADGPTAEIASAKGSPAQKV